MLRRGAVTVRRHWLFAALFAAGAVVRVLFTASYYPALAYGDTSGYITEAPDFSQDPVHGPAYPAFLHVISWLGNIAWVPVLQHTAVLAVAIGVYVVLVRLGLPRWLAAAACVPLLLDSREILLEQYVLTDSSFTVLLIAAVLLVLYPTARRPWWVYALSGLLLSIAGLERSVATTGTAPGTRC